MSSGEQTVWQGRPSQIVNFNVFLVCLLLCWLIVPIFIAIWKWLEVRCLTYELTSQRLKTASGILTKKTDELELYRIKDTSLVEPFFFRLFSVGNVVLMTSDRSTPELTIEAIPDAENVREQIRSLVESLRDTKRVREVDFE